MRYLYDLPVHQFLVLQEDHIPAADLGSSASDVEHSSVPAGAPPKEDAAAPRFHPWRVGERLRTSNAILCMCLNIGIDPPGIVRPNPSARMECWIDPQTFPKSADAMAAILTAIGKQYERWHRRARDRVLSDPTHADLRRLTNQLRRSTGKERLLFHYNGHGVPKPTSNGEVWLFSPDYTQYMPVSITEIQTWVSMPVLYVFDIHNGGLVVEQFTQWIRAGVMPPTPAGDGPVPMPDAHSGRTADPTSFPRLCKYAADSIVLTPCGVDELLPMHPDLPADLFTCCLTTPIEMALRWSLIRSSVKGVTVEMLDNIPGSLTDRTTLLGCLNWIFTAVTDCIAWNVIPRDQFQRLFRQDLLLASIMRNFLFADRVMRFFDRHPVSYPQLPETHNHPLWGSFDLMLEKCLSQVSDLSKQKDADALRKEADELAPQCNELFEKFTELFDDHLHREHGVPGADASKGFSDPSLSLDEFSEEVESTVADQKWPLADAQGSAPNGGIGAGSTSSRMPSRGGKEPMHPSHAGHSRQPSSDGSSGSESAATRSHRVSFAPGVQASQAGAPGSSSSAAVLPRYLDRADLAALDPHPVAEIENARKKWKDAYDKVKELRRQADDICEDVWCGKFKPPRFFEDHMRSFEVWLDLNAIEQTRDITDKLPILLQVLLSQHYRFRALFLLSRYLQRGTEAVDLVLSVGYFPYIEKLLTGPNTDFRKELMFVWGKVLAVDRSVVADFVKVRGEIFCLDFLRDPVSGGSSSVHPVYLVMAEYALSCVARFNPNVLRDLDVVPVCIMRMQHENSLVRRWGCLCVNELLKASLQVRREWMHCHDLVDPVSHLATEDVAPDVRGAAVELLSTLVADALPLIHIGDPSSPPDLDEPSSASSTLPTSGSAPQPMTSASASFHQQDMTPQPGGLIRSDNSPGQVSTPTTGGTSGYEVSGSSAPSSLGVGDSGGNQNAYGSTENDAGGPGHGDGDGVSGGSVGSSGGDHNPGDSVSQFSGAERIAEAQTLFQLVANVFHNASECCSSVLVRREVGRALSNMARARLEIFRAGHQWHGLALERERASPGMPYLSGVDAACRNLYVALHRYSQDPHPIVYSHAHAWHSKVVEDFFAHHSSDSFGAGRRSFSVLFGDPPAESVADRSSDDVRPTDSFASGLSFSSPAPVPEQSGGPRASGSVSSKQNSSTGSSPQERRFHGADASESRTGPGSGSSATPRSPHEGLPPRHESLPPSSLSPPSIVGNVPGQRGSKPGGAVAPLGFSVAGVTALSDAATRAGDAPVHTRSGSGSLNLDLSRGTIGNRGRNPGLGEAQALTRRHSTGAGASANSAGSIAQRPLPMYPVVLANGVGQLIRTVSQTFKFNLPRPSSGQEKPGERAGEDAQVAGKAPELHRSGPRESPTGSPVEGDLGGSRNLATDSRPPSGVSSASPLSPSLRQGLNVSYQLVGQVPPSPPHVDSGRLPMPRNGSFVVGPLPGPDRSGHRRKTSRGLSTNSRGDSRAAFLSGSSSDKARTLYEWSVECIPRLKFETDSPDCMDVETEHVEAWGYEMQGYRFRAPDEDKISIEELCRYSHETRTSTKPSEKNDVGWDTQCHSHVMAAAGGSILAIMFLPRHVGPSEGPLVVTGDMGGRVGVYEVHSGAIKASFGIPGPPGADAAVTAVLSLNSTPGDSSWSSGPRGVTPYESALILAGAVDGRIAVFKSDFLEPSKYGIVSTFRGSGFAKNCEYGTGARVLPIGAWGEDRRIASSSDQMATNLRRDGNGLVLSYHSRSSRLVAGGCQEGVVRAWDLEAEKTYNTANVSPKAPNVITALTMFDDLSGDTVAYSGSDGRVGLIDMRLDGRQQEASCLSLGVHDSPVVSMASCMYDSANGVEMLASGDLRGNIMLWDLRVNREVARIKAHADIMTTMATHPRSRLIASGGNCVKVFDENNSITGMIIGRGQHSPLAPGSARNQQYRQYLPRVTALAFQADASLLAVGCADSTVRFHSP